MEDFEQKETGNNRRKFIFSTCKSVAFGIVGATMWSNYASEMRADSITLRPPAAIDEERFIARCIKCGLCVEACPFDVLKLAKFGDNKFIGTPYFEARKNPCRMCVDVPCVPVCPSKALDILLIADKSKKWGMDINKSKMGLALVDDKSCIAFWGIQCDACYQACPLPAKAINLDYQRNERTGKHAFLMPKIDSEHCTGCGLCEKACVTKKPAIHVKPNHIAKGEIDVHYIKGWDSADAKRLEGVSIDVQTKTKRSEQKVTDYLNSGGLLDD